MAVGCSLFLDSSIKQTAGIAIVGIAFSWLIGSLTLRALSVACAILICAAGLYVGAAPVWSDWKSAQTLAAEYDVAISYLQTAVKNAVTIGQTADIPPPPQGYTLDTSTYQPIEHGSDPQAAYSGHIDFSAIGGKPVNQQLSLQQFAAQYAEKTRVVTVPKSVKSWTRPEQKTDADVVVDISQAKSEAEVMRAFTTSFLLPRPTFHLASSVRAHAWRVIGGLALFASGLSVLGWLLRRTVLGSSNKQVAAEAAS
jgi:hypothetical protein